MKPSLAENYIESKIRFPVIAQPKIDGVRGLNLGNGLVGRSLKPFKNKALTAYFSQSRFVGLDGELASGPWDTHRLCSVTTGDVNRIEGDKPIIWNIFDYVTAETVKLPYIERYALMLERLEKINDPRLGTVVSKRVSNLEDLLKLDAEHLSKGLEGTILRNPASLYKEGRSTKEGQLWRIKRFIEEEALCAGITEGNKNNNAAKTNELGRTERSTHAANMEPNGMVGSLQCVIQKDILHDGKLLFARGLEITVSPGEMSHKERVDYFQHPDTIINQVIKFKTFPQGVLTQPRMPTFVSIRTAEDIS